MVKDCSAPKVPRATPSKLNRIVSSSFSSTPSPALIGIVKEAVCGGVTALAKSADIVI